MLELILQDMCKSLANIAAAFQSIAASLEKIANPPQQRFHVAGMEITPEEFAEAERRRLRKEPGNP